ncbi:MAG TPA: hypothetical protein ENJ82_02295 [Bacteroidetes bacterium]|nr:hypothetical protein [Bacteroidota bacterium]
MGKEININTFIDQEKGGRETELPSLETAIVRTLLYFDLFRYPLAASDLARNAMFKIADEGSLAAALQQLHARGMVVEEAGFYYIGEGKNYVQRRKKGNALAEKRLEKARKVSNFICKFPFVEAVMVSGSLSKHYMEADSDLDFFIVTRPGRLWIARTLLILYKKVFLLNSHQDFCVNYFVDSDHLEIEDQNIFTATELVYLLPTSNVEMYHKLRKDNAWADAYYPNFGLRETAECHPENSGWLGKSLEKLLSGKLGERLDAWSMKRTMRRWKSKFDHFDESKFEVALRTREYVSKHHPTDYQQYVVRGLEKKISDFESKHGIKLAF